MNLRNNLQYLSDHRVPKELWSDDAVWLVFDFADCHKTHLRSLDLGRLSTFEKTKLERIIRRLNDVFSQHGLDPVPTNPSQFISQVIDLHRFMLGKVA